MKKQYLVSMLALCAFIMVSITIPAQMPLPCVEYTNDNVTTLYGFHGSKSVGCMEINMEETPIHMNDDDVRDYHVQDASIKTGYSYVPSGDNGRFSITLGEREEMEGAWFEPINYFPQLYEKIEWGLKLPAEVEQAIDNWINNDQFGTEHYPALNPFDPEQIDVKAIVDYTDESGNYHSQPVFGFFYRDYQRITVYNNPYGEDMDDPDNWRWDEIPTEFRFRFRWASDVIAHHSVRLTVNVPSMGYWELAPFEFDSYWGDPRQSFVSVTDNGHYFKTADNHVFFPVGLNINEGTFGCSCMEGVSDVWDEMTAEDCEACYGEYNPVFNSTNSFNPCCGIRKNKRKRGHDISPEPPVDENGLPIFDSGLMVQGYSLAPAAYLKLEQVLITLKEKGGNSFRTIIDPTTYDIEFEKLNNYYDRQYQAWEFDQVLNHCNELDLRVELNMLMHYAIMYHAFGSDKFDWDNTFNSGGIDPGNNGTHGFCYWRELGLDTPLDFLTNPAAISNYKKKIRYMISRWGYSKNIFLFELVSEMNNIGKNDAITGDMARSLYDRVPELTRPAVAAWHNEIASYIKQDLSHTRHLIAADFTGQAPMEGYDDSPDNPCQSEYFDDSWHCQYIDVMAWNNYNDGNNRWEKMALLEYKKEPNQTSGYMCGNNDPSTTDDDSGWHSPLIGHYQITKPAVYGENAHDACLTQDNIGFIKDLIVGPFSGHASSGMSWDEWSSTSAWSIFGVVNQHLNQNILNDIDLGTGVINPNHAYSTSILGQISDDAPWVEIVYLKKETAGCPKYAGVIMNRTWNYYSMHPDWDECHSVDHRNEHFSDSNYDLGFLSHIYPGVHTLKLSGAGFYHYTIRYFNPYTSETINEVNKWSFGDKLELTEYPSLYDGSNGHHPFYFFEAFQEGSEFDQIPMINQSNSQSKLDEITTNPDNDASVLMINQISQTVQSTFIAHPNPTLDFATIHLLNSNIGETLIVRNAIGTIVTQLSITSTRMEIDMSYLASGVYSVSIGKNPIIGKIIKI